MLSLDFETDKEKDAGG